MKKIVLIFLITSLSLSCISNYDYNLSEESFWYQAIYLQKTTMILSFQNGDYLNHKRISNELKNNKSEKNIKDIDTLKTHGFGKKYPIKRIFLYEADKVENFSVLTFKNKYLGLESINISDIKSKRVSICFLDIPDYNNHTLMMVFQESEGNDYLTNIYIFEDNSISNISF